MQPITNSQLLKQLQQVRIGTKEDVETCFIPVSFLITPGCNLTPQYILSLNYDRLMTCINKVFCTGKTSQSCAGDRNSHVWCRNIRGGAQGFRVQI